MQSFPVVDANETVIFLIVQIGADKRTIFGRGAVKSCGIIENYL